MALMNAQLLFTIVFASMLHKLLAAGSFARWFLLLGSHALRGALVPSNEEIRHSASLPPESLTRPHMHMLHFSRVSLQSFIYLQILYHSGRSKQRRRSPSQSAGAEVGSGSNVFSVPRSIPLSL